MIKGNVDTTSTGWAESEFGIVDFGDKRLSKRLLKIADLTFPTSERRVGIGEAIGVNLSLTHFLNSEADSALESPSKNPNTAPLKSLYCL